ncbi:hypothetical protein CMV_013902 [Castanea mollissima]|uniref:Uncharacterized protein n=1 Tax=Castanea mollissima TaxID=60419 RepID=A0A8J4RCL2_9ROSI|nr:hypothetical protein CMV_013902 [Castanea mollissima]
MVGDPISDDDQPLIVRAFSLTPLSDYRVWMLWKWNYIPVLWNRYRKFQHVMQFFFLCKTISSLLVNVSFQVPKASLSCGTMED